MKAPSAFKRWLLKRALDRVAPNRIPRSGPEGEAADCFIVRVKLAPDEPVIIQSLSGDSVECLEYDGERYSVNTTYPVDAALDAPIEITHYHGLATTTYSGWLSFVVGQAFRVPYIRAWWHFKSSDLDQYLFNKQQLVTKERIDILRTVLDSQLNERQSPSSLTVMTRLYSIRWVLHPNHEERHGRVELYLEALSETGELRKSGSTYSITGQGLAAIETYEEQTRRHAESIATQRRMVWLTVVIALLAVFQAGLVKLPPLIDFGSEARTNSAFKPMLEYRDYKTEKDRTRSTAELISPTKFWLCEE